MPKTIEYKHLEQTSQEQMFVYDDYKHNIFSRFTFFWFFGFLRKGFAQPIQFEDLGLFNLS